MSKTFIKGSEWRKWDLHVHTPVSYENHFSERDTYIKKLKEKAVKHDIEVVGINDYFSVDGYEKLLDECEDETKKTNPCIKLDNDKLLHLFPVVELRLENFTSDNESVNIHVVFSPDLLPSTIRSSFLEKLTIKYQSYNNLNCKADDLIKIGHSEENSGRFDANLDFSSLSEQDKKRLIHKALKVISFSISIFEDGIEKFKKILIASGIKDDKYLIIIANKGSGGLDAFHWHDKLKDLSRAGNIRQNLLNLSDACFSNDSNDIQFLLGQKNDTTKYEILNRFRSYKPCIWGSDAHTEENLFHPSNGNTNDYTWVKADPTFEGLKQIIFEPELRVRIQKDNPSETETYAMIEKCAIKFPNDLKIRDKESTEVINFCLCGKYTIEFSNNLTCIIGGRGSGKSTLVHILYNSWIYKDTERLFELNSPLTSLSLSSKDTLGEVRNLIQVDIPENTEFYLQNEIEKFAKDIQEMSKLVRHRLERISSFNETQESLEKLKNEWSTTSLSFDELITAYDNIADTNKKSGQLNNQIVTITKQTNVIKSGEYKKICKEIEEIANAISGFESYENEYKKIMGELDTIIKNIQKLDWSKYAGQDILQKIKADLTSHKDQLGKAFTTGKAQFDKNDYHSKLTGKKTELKQYLKDKGLSPENIGELADAAQQIARLKGEIQSLRAELSPYEEIYSLKAKILDDYKSRYQAYHTRFFAVSTELQNSLAGLKFAEQQTEITFHPRTNEQLLKDSVVDYIKKNNTLKALLSADNVQAVLFDNDVPIADLVSDKQKILQVINKSQKATIHTQVLQELFSNDVFLEKFLLRMQKYYFDINNIQVQTKLGPKLLQNTSFGERCGIVIAIVLVAGTNPIVIDQPEDNLDGKFISNVLVPLLKKQKQNRQIILITRDANIAIGGDSELIAILEGADTGRTEVLPATIENKEARPKYIWILDGGEKAFQTREEKYNLA